jgi:hypothetical protein
LIGGKVTIHRLDYWQTRIPPGEYGICACSCAANSVVVTHLATSKERLATGLYQLLSLKCHVLSGFVVV